LLYCVELLQHEETTSEGTADVLDCLAQQMEVKICPIEVDDASDLEGAELIEDEDARMEDVWD
jgi:hypothetical protein